MACGGGEIYRVLLEQTKEAIVTKIQHEFEGCDTKFPNLGKNEEWEQEFLDSEEDGDYTTNYIYYKRK